MLIKITVGTRSRVPTNLVSMYMYSHFEFQGHRSDFKVACQSSVNASVTWSCCMPKITESLYEIFKTCANFYKFMLAVVLVINSLCYMCYR